MRILHTSDWHLGKRLFKLDRSEEHKLFLDWLIKTLVDQEIDLLLIAGDIFDTPTPPHQSLETFYHFLHRVSIGTKTQTFIIAGNHDSGLLLEAPAGILASHRVKVWGKLSPNPEEHWITIKDIDLCAIPFFRSYELLPQGEGDAITALTKYLEKERIRPQILMLHHLAGMFEAAGSEQVISLSGVDSIPSDLLKSFDYVALGHIHKPQRIGNECYYSGSPIPLRFSETAKKSVVIVDVKEGKLTSVIHPIPQFRNFFIVKTNENDFRSDLSNLSASADLTPMVEVQIELTEPRSGLVDEIKSILTDKGMELLSFMPFYQTSEKAKRKNEKIYELSPLELFEEFYKAKYPESDGVPEDLRADFAGLLQKVKDASHPS
ncbi:MAG: exonuclease SbcCD subunit D [Bacteriovoracia bacterium]